MAETHLFCDPLRQQLQAVDDEIAGLLDGLEHGDFPPQDRAKLQERLQKLRMLRPHVANVLTQCAVSAEGATARASPNPPAAPNPPS